MSGASFSRSVEALPWRSTGMELLLLAGFALLIVAGDALAAVLEEPGWR